jgi:hypothetical protein
VERKLQALLVALRRRSFDVAAANAAMKQVIRTIVMDVEQGELAIYWKHVAKDAEPQVVPFPRFQREPTSKKKKRRPQAPRATPSTVE